MLIQAKTSLKTPVTVSSFIQISPHQPHTYVDSVETSLQSDSLSDSTQLLISDVIDSSQLNVSKVPANNEIDAIIEYNADDSMLYLIKDKMLFLYGNADVTYKAINLKGAKIDFDWKTTTVQAEGMPDSNGNLIGKPIFKDGEKSYNTKKLHTISSRKKGKYMKF